MVNALQFVNFMLSAGIINLAAAQQSGTPAALAFFKAIGFDAPTAQLLTTQLMSMPGSASTSASRLQGPSTAPIGGPRTVAAGGTTSTTTTNTTALSAVAPRLTVLPTGFPLVARS